MTIEESKAMWNIEKSNVDQVNFTKGMKALYKAVDKVIENGIITYEDFTNDTIDELTTLMVQEGKGEIDTVDRVEQIDLMCKRLTKRYEEKYNARELGTGITELSTDSAEVSDPKKLHESECITEESVSDNTEIE
ncbi:hypothetical protein [uncultured phage cr56_1]|uniref:Uncharacterized protein n=1 Tax=uncultured phage cr56_1 TaxID=2772081 RepID=A0A7M1RRF7_9CAUD|nr:hypothetical protein KNV48_gp85 [uncultured phage cr56_1]QOR56888.1 hypothetical protein [uncultured phage cr56_1]